MNKARLRPKQKELKKHFSIRGKNLLRYNLMITVNYIRLWRKNDWLRQYTMSQIKDIKRMVLTKTKDNLEDCC